ncbi:MAG: methionine biosynthesis protein MetW [Alphaproteobacteria bacterium]
MASVPLERVQAKADADDRAPLRKDLGLIADLVTANARVLDVGCGDGALLGHLTWAKGADARGIELSQAGVKDCLSRGLSVVQGDAEKDLHLYPDSAFDYVILSQAIQAMRRPDDVLNEMLRIGRFGIVSFANYAHWRARWHLLRGRMPPAGRGSDPWYSTPNIRPCTLEDFEHLCSELGLMVEQRICLAPNGQVSRIAGGRWFDNLLSAQALFVLSRKGRAAGGFAHLP